MNENRWSVNPEVEKYIAELPDKIGDSASLWGYELCKLRLEKQKLQEKLDIIEQEYDALYHYGFPKFYEEGKDI